MATPAPTKTVRDLSFLLSHAGHLLNTRMTAALAEIGITPRHQCVLAHAMAGEYTQIQLADLADLDKTTMVVTLDDLEKAGFAERRPSSTDRRARIVSVTETGEEIVRRGQQIVDRVHLETLRALPTEHRNVFVAALGTLVEGPLAEPARSDRPVRRARRPRK